MQRGDVSGQTYHKPPTTHEQQIALLVSRGMSVENEGFASQWLKTVGYYRLGAYWLVFEEPPQANQTRSKKFVEGTKFVDVTDLYIFDRDLRLLVMEAIERVEIAIRTSWTYELSNAHGAHAYLDPSRFTFNTRYGQQLAKLERRVEKSNERFIKHYLSKYSMPPMPPIWCASELMTFGELSRWVEKTKDTTLLRNIARDIGFPTRETLTGTVESLSYVRNICAHHGRLWNRRFVKRPPKVKTYSHSLQVHPESPSELDNTIYNVLTLLCIMLRKQSPETTYPARIKAFVEKQPAFRVKAMGYEAGWQSRPVWKI